MPRAPTSLPAKEGFEIALLGGAEDPPRDRDAGFRGLLLSPGVTAATRADSRAGPRLTGEVAATLTLLEPPLASAGAGAAAASCSSQRRLPDARPRGRRPDR